MLRKRYLFRAERGLCAVAIAVSSMFVATVAAAQSGTALTVRIRTVEDAAVSKAELRIADAHTGMLLRAGTTNAEGQARFDGQLPTEVRVSVGGVQADGTPLRQVGQDQEGLWVRLPDNDWTMDLRVDADGTVFPDLTAAGVGAVDGLDATAIANGSFALIVPTPLVATSIPSAGIPRPMTTAEADLATQHTAYDTPVVADARSASTLPALALLMILTGLTVVVATTVWRGKL